MIRLIEDLNNMFKPKENEMTKQTETKEMKTKPTNDTINEIKAMFVADLGYQLANSYLKRQKKVPTLDDIREGIGNIANFSSLFVRVEIGDDGQPEWNNVTGTKCGLVDMSYDRMETRTSEALEVMVGMRGPEIKSAAYRVYGERHPDVNKREVYIPPAPTQSSYTNVNEALKAFVAYRIMFPAGLLLSLARNHGNQHVFNSKLNLTIEDIDAMVNLPYVAAEEGADNAPVDHAGDAAWEIDFLLQQKAKVKLHPVELSKALELKKQVAAWYDWVKAMQATDELEEQIQAAREGTKRFIEQNNNSGPFQGQKAAV
jgi:hypothetical protein